MAFDKKLTSRTRKVLAKQTTVTEKTMFGGVAFMLGGHMCCGVAKDNLVVRIHPQEYEQAITEPYARPMDLTGRPLRGFVYVGPAGYRTDEDLERWLGRAVGFASSLPPKPSTERGRGPKGH